jgi:hypothetical protein
LLQPAGHPPQAHAHGRMARMATHPTPTPHPTPPQHTPKHTPPHPTPTHRTPTHSRRGAGTWPSAGRGWRGGALLARKDAAPAERRRAGSPDERQVRMEGAAWRGQAAWGKAAWRKAAWAKVPLLVPRLLEFAVGYGGCRAGMGSPDERQVRMEGAAWGKAAWREAVVGGGASTSASASRVCRGCEGCRAGMGSPDERQVRMEGAAWGMAAWGKAAWTKAA